MVAFSGEWKKEQRREEERKEGRKMTTAGSLPIEIMTYSC
jgi:hypothetical protein